MMLRPRCGNKDLNRVIFAFNKHLITPQKWNKSTLTYYIESYTADISKKRTDEIIAEAFKFWSDVTPLKFKKQRFNNADIVIR